MTCFMFSLVDDILNDIYNIPLIDKAQNPLYEVSKEKYYIYYIVICEIEGIEWFVKHLPYTYIKVRNINLHTCIFCFPFLV
jgi:hypothetical protein